MITKKQKSMENSKKEECMVYVGPSLSEGRLSFSTVYIGGYPQHLMSLLEKEAWMKKLFVPVSQMNEAIQETKKSGTLLNIFYNKAKEV